MSRNVAPLTAATFVALWLTVVIANAGGSVQASAPFKVTLSEIDDLKSAYATVRSKDLIEARVRTPGTIVSLKADEGSAVKTGDVIALVADPKIALKISAIDAQIKAIQSRTETAKTELSRSEQLRAKGVSPQARVDQAQTAYDVAANDLKAAIAERAVIETQVSEGEILAPAAGRVLKVPVTAGSVVLPGESIATIAANDYLLRIELPERHARFIKIGDAIQLGVRGMDPEKPAPSRGRIVQVYPELIDGRVIADADVAGLSQYFIGERVLVQISAGKRQTVLIPPSYIVKRFGLDTVRLATSGPGPGLEITVQPGQTARAEDGSERIEILSGLKSGDVLVKP